MTDWSRHFATRASRMAASEIRELLKLLDQPDIISFAGGIPDPALFPRAAIARAYGRILGDPARAAEALQYAVSEGYHPLRQWLAGYMGRLGVACTAEHILITSGAQQALDFLGKLFLSPGDRVLVGRPTYLGALQAFGAYEAEFGVLPGPDGDRPAGAKLGYVMPDFQNPTGLSLTLAEREALLDAAEALDLPLIEDGAYEKLRYDGAAVPSLLALASARTGGIDRAGVIYCGTFSKTIVPSLRIGWIVAPAPVARKLVLIKQASDLHTSPLSQMVMLEVASALIEPHAAELRAVYRTRRDALLAALERHMPAGVRWTRPEGGMFVWLTLTPGLDGAQLLRRAIAEQRIAFVPGAAFFADRSVSNTIRLSFPLNPPAVAEEGIARLGRLLAG